MNVSDISDERLNEVIHRDVDGYGKHITWLSGDEQMALCRAELSRRAAKVEKVEPVNEEALSLLDYAWTIFCNAGGGDWDKESVDWVKAVQNFEIQWRKLRFPEAAKPKPASVAFAIEGVPATPGECAAFIQGVDAVKTTPIAVAGSGAARLLDADVRDARRKHLDSLDWDKPQTAGEGADDDRDQQRCNHCMTISDAELTACPKCGKDDALMFPFEAGEGAIAIEPWVKPNGYNEMAVLQLQRRVEAIENRMREGK